MAVNVAISGFGRIGRLVLRSIIESKRKDINVVAINDLAPIETNAFPVLPVESFLPVIWRARSKIFDAKTQRGVFG